MVGAVLLHVEGRTHLVSVVVIQPFSHLGKHVFPGADLEMEPIDAAVHAHAGRVSLLHGRTYQRKDMIAAPDPEPMSVAIDIQDPVHDPIESAPKRRRGRGRKSQG